ncbi:MAG: hypothetical protein DMG42_15815 [Acidobacteria bacterium]|nr:MAG: hypothetical protein DMG42_15815 [Acidobacteriota bacterium]
MPGKACETSLIMNLDVRVKSAAWPGPSGPDRVLVDGTEAAAHRATLVIARNRIFKIFPASSTAWPRTPK